MRITLCWSCKNACGGCSWSKSLTPVKGWQAEKTLVSYLVIKCPNYRWDGRSEEGATTQYQPREGMPELRDTVRQLFYQGMSDDEIAAVIGRSAYTVQNHRRQMKLIRKACDKEWNRDKQAKIRELHAMGLTDKEISLELQRPYSTVVKNRRRLGLKANGRREEKKCEDHHTGEAAGAQ